MEVFSDEKTSKNINIFFCEICDFSCCKKGDWNRHILRPKHLNLTKSNGCVTLKTSNICELCKKEYKSRNGLWSHKKKCKNKDVTLENNNNQQTITPELVMELIKNNKELRNIILEQHNT
jgi:hypothetical protein